MAKKINFSSVKKQVTTVNVDVIEINTFFIAKTIRALGIIENAMEAGVFKKENGEVNYTAINSKHVQKIYEEVLPFLKELEEGLMSDSKEQKK